MAAERFKCLAFISLVILSEILVPWAVRGEKNPVGKQVKENEYQQVVHQNTSYKVFRVQSQIMLQIHYALYIHHRAAYVI